MWQGGGAEGIVREEEGLRRTQGQALGFLFSEMGLFQVDICNNQSFIYGNIMLKEVPTSIDNVFQTKVTSSTSLMA